MHVIREGRGLAVEGGGGGTGGHAVGLRAGGRDGRGGGAEELGEEGVGGFAVDGAASRGGQAGIAAGGVWGLCRLRGQRIREAL